MARTALIPRCSQSMPIVCSAIAMAMTMVRPFASAIRASEVQGGTVQCGDRNAANTAICDLSCLRHRMKILVECPFCETRFRAERDELGIQGKCVKCCRRFVFSGIKTRDKKKPSTRTD